MPNAKPLPQASESPVIKILVLSSVIKKLIKPAAYNLDW